MIYHTKFYTLDLPNSRYTEPTTDIYIKHTEIFYNSNTYNSMLTKVVWGKIHI
jgi:hypothetical protein